MTLAPTPINSLIEQKQQELRDLVQYPEEKLTSIIRGVGFKCDLCSRCCTEEFNDHVFLLDADTATIKQIDAFALTPAPYFEFCDQHGRFYVSGYALKSKPDGSCYFLEGGRCRIYSRRLSICRVYPYMLHREADESGNVDWRQVSGLDEHGCYHTEIGDVEAREIAKETKNYEKAFLEQEINFLKAINTHFTKNGLRHIQKVYDRQMRLYQKGGSIEVCVYYSGTFEKNVLPAE
ncbi:MAG: YkgJ family cysteine cluster protein [ANME-2 cluster archaeon]|jgi:Fe-S-cluster containining protein|nr:YkgJ family cysteine cluster protein [ANME-2 cluster archaeon]